MKVLLPMCNTLQEAQLVTVERIRYTYIIYYIYIYYILYIYIIYIIYIYKILHIQYGLRE